MKLWWEDEGAILNLCCVPHSMFDAMFPALGCFLSTRVAMPLPTMHFLPAWHARTARGVPLVTITSDRFRYPSHLLMLAPVNLQQQLLILCQLLQPRL